MSEEKKKIWVTRLEVRMYDLEDCLNELAVDGYQIHSVAIDPRSKGVVTYNVVAFDPMQLMKKQGEDMTASLNALMGSMKMPGTP